MKYTISLPMKDDDIKYTAKMWSVPDRKDSLAGCQYLIEYTYQSDTLPFFSAYFDGNYYKFENEKLQEYHWDWDSIPFKNNGPILGIQRNGLFAPFMPRFISEEMNKLVATPGNKYTISKDTIIKGKRVDALKLDNYINGTLSKSIYYYADASTGNPLYYESLNNPNSIAEQLISIVYDYDQPMEHIGNIDERLLMSRYHDAFSKYRQSNFSISNLPGRKLPKFTLPSIHNDRFIWNDRDNNNFIIAFLEVGNGMNMRVINDVRSAVRECDVPVDVIWMYNNKNISAISEENPKQCNDEFTLIGGKNFATDCGVTGFPTLLFVSKNGTVKDIQLGYNKELKNIVIQKVDSMNNQN